MTRILLHIGAHKTGTTYIQRRIKDNKDLFPDTHHIAQRNEFALMALARNITDLRSLEDAKRNVYLIEGLAAALASEYRHAENLLISHEDLIGPLPTVAGISGLYPFAEEILPAIIRGLEQAGAKVEVALYLRLFPQWLESLYHYRFMDQPNRAFAPRRFKDRYKLPNDWTDFRVRINKAVGPHGYREFWYDHEVRRQTLGNGLFRAFGLSDDLIDEFAPLEAQTVARKKVA